ncbi:T9SS type A sorting domain-containing protein [Spirosoma foliorum]|uniref:T9SS type A sorting domain-containing protein n=1 Tax=Spirosoma foliorum TaxID=2710596 RepID=UPI001F0B0776|nr:T9SS type A sorting domain-containing protein [Spirosoma foliorum]
MLLDIANQDEGSQVIQYTASGSYVQYWKIETVGCTTTSGGRLGAEYEPVVNVYPNPAQTYVNLDLPRMDNSPVQIDLLNTTGQSVRSETLKVDGSTTHRLSVADLPNGLYLIRIQSGSLWNFTHRLLIAR